MSTLIDVKIRINPFLLANHPSYLPITIGGTPAKVGNLLAHLEKLRVGRDEARATLASGDGRTAANLYYDLSLAHYAIGEYPQGIWDLACAHRSDQSQAGTIFAQIAEGIKRLGIAIDAANPQKQAIDRLIAGLTQAQTAKTEARNLFWSGNYLEAAPNCEESARIHFKMGSLLYGVRDLVASFTCHQMAGREEAADQVYRLIAVKASQ